MARNIFGGEQAAYVEVDGVDGTDDLPQLVGGGTVEFYNLQTGGTQYDDLLDITETPVTTGTTSDGTDGWGIGMIHPLYGPDGVVEMWASVDGGPRFRMLATNLGAILAALDASYAAHVADRNAHGTLLGDLDDVVVVPAESRTDGHVLTWDSNTQSWVLEAPAAVAGAVMLDPPEVGGVYVGNIATVNPDDQDEPWFVCENTYSAGDSNPDFYVLNTRNATNNLVKVWWHNGNMEARAAPSLPNRVAFRVFETAESLSGPSTQRVFEVSTNPTNTANREALLGAYGTGHSTKPGWVEATRILSGIMGVRFGGNYNSLTALTWRGQRASSGAPTSGTWISGDTVVDSAGAVWVCTASGTPGTWVGTGAVATSFTSVSLGTNMSHGSVSCATRLDAGGQVARMRGILVAGASISSNATIGTVTSAHRPLHTVTTNARTTGGGARLRINTDGTIQYGSALTSSDEVWLDNISWDLSA